MVRLTAEEERFLKRRAARVRTWPIVGTLLLTMLLGLGIWLLSSVPMLANPVFVQARLENDAIPCATLALSAALLPVVVLSCLLILLALLLFAFVAFAHERRYQALLEKLRLRLLRSPTATRSPYEVSASVPDDD